MNIMMKRKIISIVVALVMVLTMIPMTAFGTVVDNCADGDSCTNHEAAIGTVHYDTLEEAIKATNDGEVVTVLKDVELTVKRKSTSPHKKIA